MGHLYTIGFTKKTAYDFFRSLINNGIKTVVDIRLNNTSQLSGFSKYPDIEFFLRRICDIDYIHEMMFTPLEKTLNDYKKKVISWNDYTKQFNDEMERRDLRSIIKSKYIEKESLCLLCSEQYARYCHRSLVADFFVSVNPSLQIVHLK